MSIHSLVSMRKNNALKRNRYFAAATKLKLTDKTMQIISPKGIPSEEAVGEPVIENVVKFISEQRDPIQFAQELLGKLKEETEKLKTNTARRSIRSGWSIGTSENKATRGFLDKFKPNTIEKVAAYTAIITLFIQLSTKEPNQPVVINNLFIQNIEQNYSLKIDNNFK